jgi:transposase
MPDTSPQTGEPAEAFTHFVGFDWASDHHDIAAVDAQGRVVLQLRFDDTAEGWQQFRQALAAFPRPAVCVETSSGCVAQRLLDLGPAVFPVNPKAADRYRQRKSPAGVKDDELDAWSLADALRLDGHGWRRLLPEEPLAQELRLLCRDETQLIAQRTALINQLRAALREYYPVALQAFEDWTVPAAWSFLLAFPTPRHLAAAGARRQRRFLKEHGLLRPQTAQKRLACFAEPDPLPANAAVTAAKSLLAATLATTLLALEQQLKAYRKRIGELFESHPDKDLFGSLPGAGGKLAPRLLSEIGADRDRFDSPQALQCYAGTAPVSFQSGQAKRVKLRRAANLHLRAAVHLWSDLSRKGCSWAAAYYRHHRDKGKSHACALRCLGQRWLKVLWKMWQDRRCYDEQRRTDDQRRHGSFVATLIAAVASDQGQAAGG